MARGAFLGLAVERAAASPSAGAAARADHGTADRGRETEILVELPLAPDREGCCAVEQLATLPARGVRFRTRALTTTMFARYFLGDLFLHGIGGAKYDELGDEISGRFFGIEPPSYLTLSMTLWLGLDNDPAAPRRLANADREIRDLTYNPDRHLGPSVDDATKTLVEAKRRAVAGPVDTHAQRLERFREIRRCNDGLQDQVEARRSAILQERGRLLAGVERSVLSRNREFAFVLHSRSRLRAALIRALPGLQLVGG